MSSLLQVAKVHSACEPIRECFRKGLGCVLHDTCWHALTATSVFLKPRDCTVSFEY